jgi:hypothetical protein
MSYLQKIVYPSQTLWTPSGMAARYDASALTGIAGGGSVAAWPDISGNGFNLAATGTSPLYRTNQFSGLPAVQFNRTGMLWLNTAGLSLSNPATLFVVATRSTGGGGFDYIVGDYSSGVGSNMLMVNPSPTVYWFQGNYGCTGTLSSPAALNVYGAVSNGVSSLLRLNGNQFTGNAGSSSTTGIILGGNQSAGATYNGLLGEAILYPSQLSTANLQNNEGYLAWKWGSQALLPSGHPWAGGPPSVGTPPSVLPFVYPARNQDPYIPDEKGETDYSSYGDDQTVLERIDHFIEFDMPLITLGADTANWEAFLEYAATGGHFDYYPDLASSSYTTCHLMSKGNRVAHKYPGMNKLNQTIRFRKVIS